MNFYKAFGLVVADSNSCFPKKETHLVRFHNVAGKTKIDYLLIQKDDKGFYKDSRVILSKNIMTQYEFLVMD